MTTMEKMAVLVQIRIALLTDRASESESDVDHLYFVGDVEKSNRMWKCDLVFYVWGVKVIINLKVYFVGGVEKSLIE